MARDLILAGEYIGGHPNRERQTQASSLHIGEDGVKVGTFRKFIVEPWSHIDQICAEGPDGLSRFTATRLLLFGPLGLALKKEKKLGFVVVSGTFGEFIFKTKKTPQELRATLAPWQGHISPRAGSPTAASSTDVPARDRVERLRELADLRDRGVLTEEEFASEKARLLNES